MYLIAYPAPEVLRTVGIAMLAGMARAVQADVPVPVIGSEVASAMGVLSLPLPQPAKAAGFDVSWRGVAPEMAALGSTHQA